LIAFSSWWLGEGSQRLGEIDPAPGVAEFVQRGRVGVVVGDQAPPLVSATVVELLGADLARSATTTIWRATLHHQGLEAGSVSSVRDATPYCGARASAR